MRVAQLQIGNERHLHRAARRARHAISLVRVEYAAASPALTLVHPEAQQTATLPETFVGREKLQVSRGDVNSALAAAAGEGKIDVTYTTPIENYNPIELYATIAQWEAPDRLLVYEATRGIKQLHKILSASLSLPTENIRVVAPFVGSAFGSKGFQWSRTLLTAAAARLVNRPLKLTFTRPQMFDSAGQRAHTSQQLSLAAAKDGKLIALRACQRDALFARLRISGVMREHVAHALLVSQRRCLSSTR